MVCRAGRWRHGTLTLRRRFQTVDVFTRTPFHGNPVAVVLDSGGLSTEDMRAHPTLGSCRAWLEAGGSPRSAAEIVQECGAGPVPIRRDEGRLALRAPAQVRSGVPIVEGRLEA